MSRPTLLAISGSLRSQSFSTTVLITLAEALVDKADIRVVTLHDVPLYNQDLDSAEAPGGVAQLRRLIGEADGLIIATPEFNHGIPGVLKNALDWASRPYGRSTLTGKAAFTITSSPGSVGGARAHSQLNETLASIAVRTVLRPQAVIAAVHEKIVDGRLADPTTLSFLAGGIDDLLRGIAHPAASDREAA